jgi:AcrR family transcriptional regulator
VLQAGLRLVDRDGVEALTMRRLGRELGVEAMSLYGYVANKQDLLDGVVECVYADLPSRVMVSGAWHERLRWVARQFRHALLQHPNVVGLVAARPVGSPGGLDLVESALTGLRDAGLDLAQASQAVSVVIGFTVGHVANQVGDPAAGDVDPDRYPNVTQRADLEVDCDAEFDLGLDLILVGVSRLVDGDPQPDPV